MMRIASPCLSLLSLTTTWAAHVQFKPCSAEIDEIQAPDKEEGLFDFDANSIRGAFNQTTSEDQSQIQLIVYGARPGAGSCDVLDPQEQAVTTLRLETLGSSMLYPGQLDNQSCYRFDENSPPTTKRIFSYDVPKPHMLNSFFLTIEIEGRHDTGTSCLVAPFTPAVDDAITKVATWIPVCIFLLAMIAALWRETANLSSEDPEDPDQLDPLRRKPSRTYITRVADCLSYLQFIFFSSALSLHYPGFLQPVTSRMSWSTLMLPAGVVVRDPWYDGVKDGIYEVNGTFGGTAGLEIMTQVMGGTVTTDTWLNTAALAAMVFMVLTGIVTLGQRLTWARDWFQATHSIVFRDGKSNLRAIMWTTFRLFCSYLLMPLVAWSAYLIGRAKFNPIHHTIAATAVVCMLILIIWWAMSQGDARNMGYLLIDSDMEHRNLTTVSRTHDLYSTGVFVLLFLKGATIGGLQMAGTVQLFMLVAAEIVQSVLYVMVYRATPYSSRTGAMPLVRLVVLAFGAGFLPEAAGYGSRMALGYIILVIHAVVLLGIFLIPTLWELLVLLKRSIGSSTPGHQDSDDNRPQVFGLRQLMRRPTNPPNQPLPPSSSGSWADSPSRLSIPQSSPSSALPPNSSSPSPIDGSYYFRPPRLSSAELISRASLGTARPDSHSSSTPEPSRSGGSQTSSSDRVRSDNSPLTGDSPKREVHLKAEDEGCAPSPLDPSVDYSVREADRYYVRPRKLSFRKAGEVSSEDKSGFTSRISSFWTPK